jgi:hypothetical protein
LTYQSPAGLHADSAPLPVIDAEPKRALAIGRLLPILTGMAILLGASRRIFVGRDLPIWFDEIFSAAIADQPDFATFISRCLHELSGPVYYGILWLWVKVAGISDVALRFPSQVCALAAPLIILRWGHPDRQIRMIWAAIIALLLPLTYHANEARPYALLVLLATGQTIALANLLRRPSTRGAWIWSCLSALMVLTHYFTLIVTGLQALLILSRGRDAIRWKSLLPFIPVVAWMSVHFATIIAFARPGGASFYARLPFSALPDMTEAIVGTAPFGVMLIVIIAGTSIWSLLTPDLKAVRRAFAKWDIATAATGAIAIMIVTIAALLYPCFSPRYFVPFLPSAMFGVALWARAWSIRMPACGAAIVFVFLLLGARETANHAMKIPLDPYASLNFASASRYIGTAHPRRLIFFWGATEATAGTPLFNEVAGFELKRAGQPVSVRTLIVPDSRRDPNRALLAAASQPGDAILWSYDSSRLHGALATRYMATLSQIDPGWACRDFGKKPIAVIACIMPLARTAK